MLHEFLKEVKILKEIDFLTVILRNFFFLEKIIVGHRPKKLFFLLVPSASICDSGDLFLLQN